MDKKIYSLRYTPDGVYMLIHDDIGGSGVQYRNEIIEGLARKHIEDLDLTAVAYLITHPGEEGVIAPPQEEYRLDERFVVSVAEDGLAATITFLPPEGGALADADTLRGALEASGVVYGISDMMIHYLADNAQKAYNTPIALATATLPIKGADAQCRYHFRLIRDKTPRVLPDGSVDHKNLELVENVIQDQLLVTLIPEQDGVPGTNVLGQSIPAQRGSSLRLPAGKNTRISEDGTKLLAATDGHVEYIQEKVCVVKVLEIRGDVGPATGHVTFLGDVLVMGNVLTKYNIRASGSVDVRGIIEAATVHAGGNVVVRQGIKGMGSCDVYAGMDVTAKFIENASVRANGIVRADSILNSAVDSKDSVIASGRHGLISGGVIRATKDVAAQTIGSESSTPVTIKVGITPDLLTAYTNVNGEIAKIEANLERSNQLYTYLNLLVQSGRASTEHKRQLAALEPYLDKLETELYEKKEDVRSINELMGDAKNGRVHVRGVINPQAIIIIGQKIYKVLNTWRHATFYLDEEEVVQMAVYSFSDDRSPKKKA